MTRWKVRADKPEEVITDGGPFTFIAECRSPLFAAGIVRGHNRAEAFEAMRLVLLACKVEFDSAEQSKP